MVLSTQPLNGHARSSRADRRPALYTPCSRAYDYFYSASTSFSTHLLSVFGIAETLRHLKLHGLMRS